MQNLGDVTIWTIGDNNGDFDIEDPSFLEAQDVRTTDRKKRKVKYLDRLIKSVARMARIDVKRQSPEYVICEERKVSINKSHSSLNMCKQAISIPS